MMVDTLSCHTYCLLAYVKLGIQAQLCLSCHMPNFVSAKNIGSWNMSNLTIATSRSFCSLECASVDIEVPVLKCRGAVTVLQCNIYTCGSHIRIFTVQCLLISSIHSLLQCSAGQNDISHIQVLQCNFHAQCYSSMLQYSVVQCSAE